MKRLLLVLILLLLPFSAFAGIKFDPMGGKLYVAPTVGASGLNIGALTSTESTTGIDSRTLILNNGTTPNTWTLLKAFEWFKAKIAEKTSGTAGAWMVYEASSTSTQGVGEVGPDNVSETWYRKYPDTLPSYSSIPVIGVPTGSSGPDNAKVGTISWRGVEENICFVVTASADNTAVADGTKAFCVPASLNAFDLVDVTAAVVTQGATSGSTDIQVRRLRGATAADMLSTKVTISYNEYSASDEAVNASNDDLATGDLIFVDVDAVAGTAAKGLSVTLTVRKP